jgi:hypothetical protein
MESLLSERIYSIVFPNLMGSIAPNELEKKKGGDTLVKKKYLAILSVATVSILLGSLYYSNVTFAPKPTEPTQVEVTNFPIDEQGNLKVSDRAFQEPPPLGSEPSNFQGVMTDLENLGCVIVEIYSYHTWDFYAKNYTEFRRVVYNTKVVFSINEYAQLFTIFNGMVMYYPYMP